MKTDIRVRGLTPEALFAADVVALAHTHMAHFGSEVFSVHVRMTDVYGPRGGIDTQAAITVQGPRIGSLTVEDLHENPTIAVACALERLEQVVQRDIKRLRRSRYPRAGSTLRPKGVPHVESCILSQT